MSDTTAAEAPGASIAELGLAGSLSLGPDLDPAFRVTSVAVDSREVTAGGLFAALQGVVTHGAAFAPQALKQGAEIFLTDLDGAVRLRETLGGWPKPVIVVEQPRRVLARVAARFHAGQPRVLAAITGTNGKTSVTRFLAQIWARLDHASAAFGTTGLVAENLPEKAAPGGVLQEPCSHTTPEPITLHRMLSRLDALGVEYVAMEASSHGLAQSRMNGAMVEAGGFTNLTRDHLDYHPDAEAYAAAKLTLFAEVVRAGGAAVLNCDDPLFPTAASICASRGILVMPVGRQADETGIRLIAQDAAPGGQTLRIGWRGEARIIALPLVGNFQAWNALVAAGLAIATGGDPDQVFKALEHLKGAPGRMELVARRANGAGVFVDYAHTPDAIRTAVAAIRPHTPGRVHVVLGAGGDRDPGKRPMMAEAAGEADVLIVTDDNPRSEDPGAIRAAVMAGVADLTRATEVGGRAEAILRGVDGLLPGDALIIAGKGHETGQVFADRIDPFDDREQGRAAVIALDGKDGHIIES